MLRLLGFAVILLEMAKILFQDRWFDELASAGGYEASFEAVLLGHASELWPQFTAVPFKTTVYSEEGAAKADFALIEKEYREWWIGKVEMAHHSLDSHVLPQVRILANASYGPHEAAKLAESSPRLELDRLLEMIKGRQPKVFVVVNGMDASTTEI